MSAKLACRALLYAVLALLGLSGASLAADGCNLVGVDAPIPLDSSEFFGTTPTGTVAIGENCSKTNCERYYVVSQCGSGVDYNTSGNNNAGSINFVVNTAANCSGGACDPISTYLAASMVLVGSSFVDSERWGIDLNRNESWDGWRSVDYDVRYKLQFETGKIINNKAAEEFFVLQKAENSTIRQFESDVTKYWHTNYKRSSRFFGSTWESRYFFTEALGDEARCRTAEQRCMLKAFMIKFDETDDGMPSRIVRINGKTLDASAIILRTTAPWSNDAYDTRILVRLR